MIDDNLHVLYVAIIALYLVTSLLFVVLFLMMFRIKSEFYNTIREISVNLKELLTIKNSTK